MKAMMFKPDLCDWSYETGIYAYRITGPDWEGKCDATFKMNGSKSKRLADDVSFATALAACELHLLGNESEIVELVDRMKAEWAADDAADDAAIAEMNAAPATVLIENIPLIGSRPDIVLGGEG